jgi:hypothetical protein
LTGLPIFGQFGHFIIAGDHKYAQTGSPGIYLGQDVSLCRIYCLVSGHVKSVRTFTPFGLSFVGAAYWRRMHFDDADDDFEGEDVEQTGEITTDRENNQTGCAMKNLGESTAPNRENLAQMDRFIYLFIYLY